MIKKNLKLPVSIRQINWQLALPIRQAVLWPEKPLQFSKVEGDESAVHYGAFCDDILVCVASVYNDGDAVRLRKFATLPTYQRQGIGSAMIAQIVEQLKQQQVRRFWCDARSTATTFYQQFGLAILGDELFKSGVSYYRMAIDWPGTE